MCIRDSGYSGPGHGRTDSNTTADVHLLAISDTNMDTDCNADLDADSDAIQHSVAVPHGIPHAHGDVHAFSYGHTIADRAAGNYRGRDRLQRVLNGRGAPFGREPPGCSTGIAERLRLCRGGSCSH